MKINEKTLIKYATSSNTEVSREGWLLKRNEQKPSEFARRYCVLKGNLLFMFERRIDREPLACLLLEGCRVELEDNETQLFLFKIVFSPPRQRVFVFSTDSQTSLESWMKALSCCSISILRLMLGELQAQVDELEQVNSGMSSLGVSIIKRANPFDEDNLIDLDGDRGPLIPSTSLSNPISNFEPMASSINPSVSSHIVNGSSFGISAQNMVFSRRPFIELHHFYGLQFSNYFENHRKLKMKTSVDDLLLL